MHLETSTICLAHNLTEWPFGQGSAVLFFCQDRLGLVYMHVVSWQSASGAWLAVSRANLALQAWAVRKVAWDCKSC